MGEKVPLILIAQADRLKAQMDATGEDKKATDVSPGGVAVLDQFYSGYYMTNGMRIEYITDGAQLRTNADEDPNPGPQFYQTFIMTRREWPTPLG